MLIALLILRPRTINGQHAEDVVVRLRVLTTAIPWTFTRARGANTSDTVLSEIPTDPRWQPKPARAERPRTLVAGLLSMRRGFDEIRVTWHKQVAVVDCGENLQRITCPHCAAEIDAQWGSDRLESVSVQV